MQNSSRSPASTPAACTDLLFAGLPPDVIMHILSSLDPVDIFSMRKTCRSIYRASKARAVWLMVLDRICDRYGIFKPTYPKGIMTVSELEYASLSPHLFVNLVKKYDGVRDPVSYQTRTLHGRIRFIPASTEADRARAIPIDVGSVYLVPGGRYLLTSGSDKDDDRLCLWDIGYSAHAPMKLLPIARLEEGQQRIAGSAFEEKDLWIKAVAPSLDDKDLVVVVVIRHSTGFGEARVRVYRIDPCSSNPRFDLEGQLKVEGWDPTVRLTQEGVFLCDVDGEEDFFAMWNWVQGTGCKWPANVAFLSRELIHAFERSIVVWDQEDGQILIWDIPALEPIAKLPVCDFSQMPLVVNPPKSFPQPILRKHYAITTCAPSIWQQRTGVPSDDHLCAIVNPPAICLYAIQRTAEANGRIQLHSDITDSHYDDRFGSQDEAGISPLFNCDNHLVFCSVSREAQVVAVAIPLPTLVNTADPEHQRELHAMSISLTAENIGRAVVEDYQMGFCPMSGRLVHIFGPNFELLVEDFLLPPNP